MTEPKLCGTHVLLDLEHASLDAKGIERIVDSLHGIDRRTGGEIASIRILVCGSDLDHLSAKRAAHPEWKIRVDADPIAEANRSMSDAAATGGAVLVLLGATLPSREGLDAMLAVLARDPHFAFALPRVSAFRDELLAKLDARFGDPMLATIPASAIDGGPDYYLIEDQLFSAVMIDSKIAADFESLSSSYETLWGGLRDLMARARRTGFRTVIANRATVVVPGSEEAKTSAVADRALLGSRYPEIAGFDADWQDDGVHRYESLLGRAFSSSPEIRKTLLLDLSDLADSYNGTSEAVIGLLWGLKEAKTDWSISLLVAPHVSDFHGLGREFPAFRQVWPAPVGCYTVVFRPIQPWSLQQIERLHEMGLFVFVMIFDTILNEIRVGAPVGLDKVFRFLAESADGLFYISRYTRDRYRIRFPVAPQVEELVTLLSTHPGDYLPDDVPPPSRQNRRSGEPGAYWQVGGGDANLSDQRFGRGGKRSFEDSDGEVAGSDEEFGYIFLVGNGYPHKWMRKTFSDLAEAFPYARFKALGFEAPEMPQLSGLPSGRADESAIDDLYRRARLVVYPSQYEGFGFPVIRALSHGKTVVARRSELLHEVAAQYRGPGRLLDFLTRTELVEQVARVLHGLDVDEIPLGSSLSPRVEPGSQKELANTVLEFIGNRVSKPDASNWKRRQRFFEAAKLYSLGHQG